MLKEILQTLGFKKPQEKAIAPVSKTIFHGGLNQPSISSLVDYKRASDKLLKANDGWVYRNNDVIAKEVSTIEFELYTARVVGQDIVLNPILSHPILDLLDRFNEFTSKSDAFYNTTSHKNLAGDAFWFLEGSGINIQNIFLLQPDKIELKFGDRVAGQKIITGFEFKDSIDGDQVTELYPSEDVIHFKNPNPSNPYRGKSKVEAAAEAIDTDNYAIEANKAQFKRGLITNFVLSTEMHLTPEQEQQLNLNLKAMSGLNNAYEIPIFSGGIKPEVIQMTNRDAQMIEQQKWQRDKIMSIFGNTPSVIGIVEDVNRANSESGILNWKRTTIKSEMQNIVNTLNEFFVPRWGENLVLGFKDPVPEDRDKLVNEAVTLKGASIITANEARESLGYDKVNEDGADLLTRPTPDFNLPDLPKSLKNVDYRKAFRQMGVFKTLEKNIRNDRMKSELKEQVRPIAKKLIEGRKRKAKKQDPEKRIHEAFTNETVLDYYQKQISIVEAQEARFANKVEQYINELVKRALANVPEELSKTVQTKALFDEDEELLRARIDFAPLLTEVALVSGQQARNLIGDSKPYVSTSLEPKINRAVNKFARSMLKTDRDKIIDLIAQGVANGQSIAEIRRNITEVYEGYSKVQAERVTRSEVLRASNTGVIDSWAESDVVVGKQWLTTEDGREDEDCAEMNGEIVDVEQSYNGIIRDKFDIETASTLLNYGSVEVPPLHPNCRCTLLPVLVDQKSFNARHFIEKRGLETKMKELQSELEAKDKRTKEAKELKQKIAQAKEELEEEQN